jgi:hypothetical protein
MVAPRSLRPEPGVHQRPTCGRYAREYDKEVSLVAFDLPELNGAEVRREPGRPYRPRDQVFRDDQHDGLLVNGKVPKYRENPPAFSY